MTRGGLSFDIALTGIGIGGFEQTTLETVEVFKRARIIFHLTSYHRILKRFCKNVVDLEKEYWTGELDTKIYARLANRILDEAKKGPRVVMVGDGHPSYYDDVTWDIYRRGKKRGLRVRILPAISSIDSLAANCDLEINSNGFQVFEATTLVAFNQKLNPHIDSLVMQVGWFATSLVHEVSGSKKGRFKPLEKYLRKFYPGDHPVRIMEAPFSKDDPPVVIKTTIGKIDAHHRRIAQIMSMFIPALDDEAESVDEEFMKNTQDQTYLKAIADL